MPELPEVETIRRGLEATLPGTEITGLTLFRPEVVAFPDPEEFSGFFPGKVWGRAGRRGKYLLLEVADRVLVVSLRMTGQLVLLPGPAEASPGVPADLPPHTHVLWHLSDGTRLRFTDQRRFGRLYLVGPERLEELTPAGKLGPEPLAPEFTPARLAEILARHRRPVKALLLDQSLVAGIGNIYADEILFAAGISPLRPAAEVEPEAAARLHQAAREILTAAIASRGTTVRNYQDGHGQAGGFQERLAVYGRAGEPCRRCGQPVAYLRLGGRGTCYCPRCQV
ncbi:MAG: bifunctional DNA-formamidopyrimidine glycosylase/DNA-(apurinic or apyrimidinic site) lyase [Clostridia bacterium]|nr:MAG: bifunctional DNA-formamidopyrimidine glycosylase/DNA-(apurinic or apyrimidinic site) lyase [Clostridia bacterium]